MRFTKIRQHVFSLIWSGHQPIGAYAILEALKTDYPRAAPPTVYRALDFLIEIGLIHRIESMNAFVGCTHPDKRHTGQFLICESCGGAAAVLGAARAIGQLQPPGIECHFVVAACENMINEKGIVPSDILTASNGKTIEVLNTDAEGTLKYDRKKENDKDCSPKY